MLTADRIRKFAPAARADIVKALVDGAPEIAAAGITTPLRLQHFMAQIYPETGGLKFVEENLRYSEKRLREVWPSRFPTAAAARPFANNPEALANKVYGGRLGNKKPGDGWRYRGRGMMQTTGRSNYRAAGYEDRPDDLTIPDVALNSALKFWKDNGCNAIADRDDVAALRKRINGGTHGLKDARDALAKARRIFTESPAPARPQRQPDPAPAPAESRPAPAEPATITDPHQIRLVQTWLRNLGYTEVGTPDGKIGPFTRATISAYRAAKGLPAGEHIDDELVLTLAKDTEPRVIAPERANADSAKVQEVAPEARQTWRAKVWSGIVGFGASVIAVGQGVIGYIQPAREYIQPVQDLASDVPSWVWLAAVAGVAFYIWRSTSKANAVITEAVQTGARR